MCKGLGAGGVELGAGGKELGARGSEFGVKDMANINHSDNQLVL